MKVELFKKLCANFNREPSEDLYKLWNEELEGLDDYYLDLAIKNIIRTYNYFPKLSDLYNECLKVPNVEIPTEIKTKRMERVRPLWTSYEVRNKPIDKETQQQFDDFQEWLVEFKNGK